MTRRSTPPDTLPKDGESALAIDSLTEARAWQNWNLRLEAEKVRFGNSKTWQEYEAQAREYEIQSRRFSLLSLDEELDIREVQQLLHNAREFPGLIHEITRDEIDFSVFGDDEEEIENIVCYLPDFSCIAAEHIDDWLDQRATAESTVSNLRELLEEYDEIVIEGLEDVDIKNREASNLISKLAGLVSWSASFVEQNPDFAGPARTNLYVYTHSEPKTGKVFYVGKGTGRRAWRADRHPNWQSHVQSLDGSYTVAIVAEKLTETEALEIEEELIDLHSETLVNVVKPLGRITIGFSENE